MVACAQLKRITVKNRRGWCLINQRIVLKPETKAYGYSSIVIENGGEELVVVGDMLIVL